MTSGASRRIMSVTLASSYLNTEIIKCYCLNGCSHWQVGNHGNNNKNIHNTDSNCLEE